MKVKKKLKNILAKALQPYGFSVDGIKPPGYLNKQDLSYQSQGFANLREYFQAKWQSNVQQQCDHYIEQFFKPRLTGHENVLEIGAGVGFLTHSILQAFPQLKYNSFELDPNLQQYLNNDFKQYQFHSFTCLGNSLLPTPNNSIDVILAFGVFTYINFGNMLQYFQEISRVCKTNGLLFLDIFDTDNITPYLCHTFEQHAKRGDNRPYVSGKLISALLTKQGFRFVDSFQEEGGYFSHKLLYIKAQ